ncbi:hypothetical protein [Thermofilum sp.]|uniref:hypothetical protein n=1 Tax=Thermofilum sp. TaxID=1961369 RepID=UPI00318311CE
MTNTTITNTTVTNTTTTTPVTNSSSLQQAIQLIPPPSPNFFQTILNYTALAYNWLIGFIQKILQSTILKSDPSLATTYANIIGWLVSLTAIYIILVVAEVLRKFIGYVLIIGWAFIIAVMILASGNFWH